jgi:dihydroneopterin aldolase
MREHLGAGDRLLVEGLCFVAKHGVYEEERRDGRRFRVDVEVELGAGRASGADELSQTVDYRNIAQAILDVAHGPSHLLIETLAHDMAALLLARLPVEAVALTLRKYVEGVPGEPACVGVSILRRRAP